MYRLRLLGGAVLEDEDGTVSGPASRPRPLALLAHAEARAARAVSLAAVDRDWGWTREGGE